MKKVLSLVLAIVMLMSLTTAFEMKVTTSSDTVKKV